MSIIQVRQDVRAKFNRLSQKTMVKMLTPFSKKFLLLHMLYAIINYSINYTGLTSRALVAEQPTDFVKEALLLKIEAWKMESCSTEDIIERLRQRTVPLGYVVTSWIPGSYSCIIATCIHVCSCVYNIIKH